jgi:hypothetical protein
MLKRIFIATAVSASIVGTASPQAWANGDLTKSKPLAGGISQGAASQQDQFIPCLTQLDKFGLRCVSEGKNAIAVVSEVGPMSPAYASGLQYGDNILSVKTNKDSFALTINRNGKLYALTLGAQDSTKLTATVNSSGTRFGALNGTFDPASLSGQVDRGALSLSAGVEGHPFTVQEIARVGHDGVRQGALANCWFEAAVSAVADTRDGPGAIAQMITSAPSGYFVKFPGVASPVQVTEGQIANFGSTNPARWATVLEVAESQAYPDNTPARGAMTANPGVKVGLEMLTGRKVSFVRPAELNSTDLAALLTRLRAAGKPITLASKSPAEHRQNIQPVTPNHAYSVVDFDSRTGIVTLRNPYGRERSNGHGLVDHVSKDEIRLDLATIQTFFRYVAYPE